MFRKRRVIVLVISTLVLFGLTSRAGAQHRIEGVVVDDKDQPIASIQVTAYRDTAKVDSMRTVGDGKYTLKYSSGSPITTVTYESSDWNPASIAAISGNRDHSINKVLHRIGSDLSVEAAYETLTTFRSLYIVNGAAYSEANRNSLRAQYSDALQKLKTPPDSTDPGEPGELSRIKDRLLTLYGVKK